MPDSSDARSARSLAGALLFAAVLASSCESVGAPASASANLSGTWTLSYATAGPSCDFPRGHRSDCAGGGRLTLVHQGETITGSIPLVAWCQSCGSVADAFGRVEQPLSGMVRGSRLELRVLGGTCRLVADVGPGDVVEIEGQATCSYDGVSMIGTWRMSRVE